MIIGPLLKFHGTRDILAVRLRVLLLVDRPEDGTPADWSYNSSRTPTTKSCAGLLASIHR
jgi:hypothetical protein